MPLVRLRTHSSYVSLSAALFLLLCASHAAAQNCITVANTGNHTQANSLRLQAATVQNNCSGRATLAEGTIYTKTANEIACPAGSKSGAQCINASATGGNASVLVQSYGYGIWLGFSNHAYATTAGVTWIDRDKQTALDGGLSPADECAALGADYNWNGSECVYSPGSPIVIKTRAWARYEFTSAAGGVLFDIDGDGTAEQIAWTRPGDGIAFLALDRNGDGLINDGTELFGNHTLEGSTNGFDALMRTAMETNGGVRRYSVSDDDPLFAHLLLWTDRNHNGVSEASELRPASELLSDIGLGYDASQRTDAHGNAYLYKGWAGLRTGLGRNRFLNRQDADSRHIPIWDIYFAIAQ